MTAEELIMFVVKLLAGTGVFLVGVHLLTANIEQLATNRIKNLFNRTADKKLLNVGIGAVSTALVQSSGVTTVLIVGFVNVGLINLAQATAMIMGANIGTTITAQIAALSAFPITTYIQILTFVGMMMGMVCKRDRSKKIGYILAGLGLVFIGLALMSDSMKTNRDAIQAIFETVTNPFLLFFIGIFITALVQSSSATTSVVIAMSVAGLVIGTGKNEILYIILGTNIGSCVTAVMSSFGAGTNAKRASLIHLLFNTFGSALFFILLLSFPDFMEVTFRKWFSETATQIAMFHTFFNVVCTIIFLPVSHMFVRLSRIIIKDKEAYKTVTYLDERILKSTSMAISALKKESVLLSDLAMDAFRLSYSSFRDLNTVIIDDVQEKIDQANAKSRNITDYIIKASAHCDQREELLITDIHNNVGDIMRITEIADNFTKYTKRTIDDSITFSEGVQKEIGNMIDAVERLYDLTKQIILSDDATLLPELDAVEDTIDTYRKTLVDNHVDRLNKGLCKPESSVVFISLVSNIERLGDHLTYIAHTVKQ